MLLHVTIGSGVCVGLVVYGGIGLEVGFSQF
jgi:hypothetical protein